MTVKESGQQRIDFTKKKKLYGFFNLEVWKEEKILFAVEIYGRIIHQCGGKIMSLTGINRKNAHVMFD